VTRVNSIMETPIPGLLVIENFLHKDSRGWFKESWKLGDYDEANLCNFTPVQNNVSHNDKRGSTRGLHAEPWDKLVTVLSGRVFCAWVDLRAGDGYGKVFTYTFGPETSVFIPSGVANSYQTLEDQTTYSYLVNGFWDQTKAYRALNLSDSTLSIQWPISLSNAQISPKDSLNPDFANSLPIPLRRTIVLGASGSLGKEVSRMFDKSEARSKSQLDITNKTSISDADLSDFDLIVNCSAYTLVDHAETPEGAGVAWKVNVQGIKNIVEEIKGSNAILVHFSTDYVFDGEFGGAYDEESPTSPVNNYGRTKAAGEEAVRRHPNHYLIRTSWLIGEGKNFVTTIADYAMKSSEIKVVNDQVGRLTFTKDLVAGLLFLNSQKSPFGTYHLTNSGEPASRAEIAKRIYRYFGSDECLVLEVTSESNRGTSPTATRPKNSDLSGDKIENLGFKRRDQFEALTEYLQNKYPIL
jgi:dTDP-4-dehydrorhamnose reductase/dTDP-4-dehydrorhamnose 3,5-epimerase